MTGPALASARLSSEGIDSSAARRVFFISEVLLNIVQFLPSHRAILRLAKTCKYASETVTKEAYKCFPNLNGVFPWMNASSSIFEGGKDMVDIAEPVWAEVYRRGQNIRTIVAPVSSPFAHRFTVLHFKSCLASRPDPPPPILPNLRSLTLYMFHVVNTETEIAAMVLSEAPNLRSLEIRVDGPASPLVPCPITPILDNPMRLPHLEELTLPSFSPWTTAAGFGRIVSAHPALVYVKIVDPYFKLNTSVGHLSALTTIRTIKIYNHKSGQLQYDHSFPANPFPHLEVLDCDLGLARMILRENGSVAKLTHVGIEAKQVQGERDPRKVFTNQHIQDIQSMVDVLARHSSGLETFSLSVPHHGYEPSNPALSHVLDLQQLKNCKRMEKLAVCMLLPALDCGDTVLQELAKNWSNLRELRIEGLHRASTPLPTMTSLISLTKNCSHLHTLKMSMEFSMEDVADLVPHPRLRTLGLVRIPVFGKRNKNFERKFKKTVQNALGLSK